MFFTAVFGLIQCLSVVKPNVTSYSVARQNIFHKVENNEWCSIYKPEKCDQINDKTMPAPSEWNIEHVMPQSWLKEYLGENSKEFLTAKADLNHLFAVDMRTNSSRSNVPYADCHFPGTRCFLGYEPVNESKGIVARATFYAAYQYKIPLAETLVSLLKDWNFNYPVSEYEHNRNEKVFEIQQNRNYFIDNPELANACF